MIPKKHGLQIFTDYTVNSLLSYFQALYLTIACTSTYGWPDYLFS